MEMIEGKILLKNLLKRIRKIDEDIYELSGTLTDDEVAALELALTLFDGDGPKAARSEPLFSNPEPAVTSPAASSMPSLPMPEAMKDGVEKERLVQEVRERVIVDTSALGLPTSPADSRLCLDFGTAMSKVTLVRDATSERGYEDIEVLELGVPGDQEEVSKTMLVSSVYIDNNGKLWFGQMAVKYSQIEAQNGDRQRLDNIKRYLSEEGLNSTVSRRFNPTDIEITYSDMVLAYLMFLTWTVNRCLDESEEPRNLHRRFAIPCFEGSKARDAARTLSLMIGEAQLLADTFNGVLHNGVPLADFVDALEQLKNQKLSYDFVGEEISEPLGVASSIISWKEDMSSFQSLIMVVDVGAGTSDFSMFRIGFNADTNVSTALEIENSSEGFTEAGNYLDKLLKGLILKEAGIDSAHPLWVNIQGNLELGLRDFKESLFRDGDITVRLFNDEVVSITLDKFLSLPQVERFGVSLKNCRDRILNRIDKSFIYGAPSDRLGLVLTGGGASLPMVKALAQGTINVQGKDLSLVQAKEFPQWLADEYPDLEVDYPRIAVSLGGARKRVISRGGIAKITAGDIKSTPSLEGHYSKGL